MINFNGQLKKRTVNLGNQRLSRSQIISHTQRQRQRREADKVNEAAIIKIQNFIRRYLSNKNLAIKNYDSIDLSNGSLFQFSLYTKFLKISDQTRAYLLKLNDFENIIPTANFYNALSIILSQLEIRNESDVKLVYNILRKIHTPSIKSTKIINELGLKFHGFYNARNFEMADESFGLINLYSANDPKNYSMFLTSVTSIAHLSNDFKNDLNLNDLILTADFSKPQLLNLLFLLIQLQPKDNSVQTRLIISTLELLNSTVYTSDELNDFDEDEAPKEPLTISNQNNGLLLENLYSRHFITSLVSNELITSHEKSICFTQLILLKPNWKFNFLIYLVPHFNEYLTSVKSHTFYKEISSVSEDDFFNKVYSSKILNIFSDNLSFLKYEFKSFIEILNYYLIVKNDYELLNDSEFNKEIFIELAIFLKKINIFLILNNSNNFEFLESILIKNLNQIYLKDSRLEILPVDGWLINPSFLNIQLILKLVQNYELNFKNNDISIEQYYTSLSPEQSSQLKIFFKIPFFISFNKRAEIFQQLIEFDKQKYNIDQSLNFFLFNNSQKQPIVIKRDNVLNDAYDNFKNFGNKFKEKLSIVFKNQLGETEAGIDGGGLTKEFLINVINEAFSSERKLFVEKNNEFYPNPEINLNYKYRINSQEQLEKLNLLKFIGKIIGKCLYEHILVNVNFSIFFLKKFNKNFSKNGFNDLSSFDNDLYKSFIKLLNYDDQTLNELNLNFTIDENLNNKILNINLVENGSNIKVNSTNKLRFVHEVANFKLNKLIDLQTNSFLNGLFEVIPKEWLFMFNPYELQLLISGEQNINIDDLRENTVYAGYQEDDLTIQYFWECVNEMSNENKSKLIQFVTSVPKAPLLGFKELVPKFAINKSMVSENEDDTNRLPTSSTCVNLLKLPDYRNKQELMNKLIYAINAEAGFDLS